MSKIKTTKKNNKKIKKQIIRCTPCAPDNIEGRGSVPYLYPPAFKRMVKLLHERKLNQNQIAEVLIAEFDLPSNTRGAVEKLNVWLHWEKDGNGWKDAQKYMKGHKIGFHVPPKEHRELYRQEWPDLVEGERSPFCLRRKGLACFEDEVDDVEDGSDGDVQDDGSDGDNNEAKSMARATDKHVTKKFMSPRKSPPKKLKSPPIYSVADESDSSNEPYKDTLRDDDAKPAARDDGKPKASSDIVNISSDQSNNSNESEKNTTREDDTEPDPTAGHYFDKAMADLRSLLEHSGTTAEQVTNFLPVLEEALKIVGPESFFGQVYPKFADKLVEVSSDRSDEEATKVLNAWLDLDLAFMTATKNVSTKAKKQSDSSAKKIDSSAKKKEPEAGPETLHVSSDEKSDSNEEKSNKSDEDSAVVKSQPSYLASYRRAFAELEDAVTLYYDARDRMHDALDTLEKHVKPGVIKIQSIVRMYFAKRELSRRKLLSKDKKHQLMTDLRTHIRFCNQFPELTGWGHSSSVLQGLLEEIEDDPNFESYSANSLAKEFYRRMASLSNNHEQFVSDDTNGKPPAEATGDIRDGSTGMVDTSHVTEGDVIATDGAFESVDSDTERLIEWDPHYVRDSDKENPRYSYAPVTDNVPDTPYQPAADERDMIAEKEDEDALEFVEGTVAEQDALQQLKTKTQDDGVASRHSPDGLATVAQAPAPGLDGNATMGEDAPEARYLTAEQVQEIEDERAQILASRPGAANELVENLLADSFPYYKPHKTP